jgi:signal transduction histidine kinase
MTKKKAPTLTLEEFFALAAKHPRAKADVVYRVNPKDSWAGTFGDRPTPAVYYLHLAASREVHDAKLVRIQYLDPLVGKLLRDAGYLDYGVRVRSLVRLAADLDVEVKKWLPENLDEIRAAEAARMAAEAREKARGSIRQEAGSLVDALDDLGDVAEIDARVAQEVRVATTSLLDRLK